ncbi:MAG: arginase [Phycisphaerales bacterium]|nr:arginase [Phycisphaerales bacterium]
MTSFEGDAPASQISIIGVPCGLGGGHQGTAHGPNAARAGGLSQRLGTICPTIDCGDLGPLEVIDCGRSGFVTEWCRMVRPRTRALVLEGTMPLVVGGDHAIATGSMSGACAGYRAEHGKAPGLLWIDAHVDLNTHETTPSGNLHGMPAAALLGWDIPILSEIVGADGRFDRSRMAFVGARDIDPGEKRHLEEGGIAIWSSRDVKQHGVERVMTDALEVVSPGHEPFCLSFDIDVVDPKHAPGVDTAVPDGLLPAEAMECMARAGAHGRIVSMDLVELNPEHDIDGRTALIAVDCITAAVESMQAETDLSQMPPDPGQACTRTPPA